MNMIFRSHMWLFTLREEKMSLVSLCCTSSWNSGCSLESRPFRVLPVKLESTMPALLRPPHVYHAIPQQIRNVTKDKTTLKSNTMQIKSILNTKVTYQTQNPTLPMSQFQKGQNWRTKRDKWKMLAADEDAGIKKLWRCWNVPHVGYCVCYFT